MDFIYCEEPKCFPPHHHDRHDHDRTGQGVSAANANRDVKDAWASRGGFPGPPGVAPEPHRWPVGDRSRIATVPSTGADAPGDPSPRKPRSNRQTGSKRSRRKS